MKTAYLFPGQGSQYVGMGQDLYETFPEARTIFDAANELLGFSLTDLMFGVGLEETEAAEALRQTDITQPALFVHSMAVMAVLENGKSTPDVAAGHSLGEYSALAAAGALRFEDALNIVRLRGLLMAEAGIRRPGAMAAILGMEDELVSELCVEASEASNSLVQPANFNAPGQIVISGDREAVDRALVLARERGAKRAMSLPVSGAFHSPLMEFAREHYAEALGSLHIEKPKFPVYLNVTAEPCEDPREIRARLLEQLLAPVRWSQTLKRQQEDGVTRFVEVGPGNVLTGLARRTLGRDIVTASLGKADEIRSSLLA